MPLKFAHCSIGWSACFADSLAFVLPQVRFTTAGTLCEAGAHARGSGCKLGGMNTKLPADPEGRGRSGFSPGSGSVDGLCTVASDCGAGVVLREDAGVLWNPVHRAPPAPNDFTLLVTPSLTSRFGTRCSFWFVRPDVDDVGIMWSCRESTAVVVEESNESLVSFGFGTRGWFRLVRPDFGGGGIMSSCNESTTDAVVVVEASSTAFGCRRRRILVMKANSSAASSSSSSSSGSPTPRMRPRLGLAEVGCAGTPTNTLHRIRAQQWYFSNEKTSFWV